MTLQPSEPAKRYIGVDAHPDVLTLAIMEGASPKELKLIKLKHRLALEDLIDWSQKHATPQDTFLLEASGNSFGIAEKLSDHGYQALVLESRSVSLTSDHANDDDKKAAQRIVQSWLSGHVPVVWRPDEKTRSLRLLLEAYLDSVKENTRATNRLKGILNTYTIRLGKKDPRTPATQQEILANPKWNTRERMVIQDAISKVNYASQRRETLLNAIQSEVRNNKKMLACLRIEGIGLINSFAILAIVGDIKRFATARKLASYLGLNPGSKTSGNSIHIKYGIGNHGRRDLKALLIQAAQTILKSRRNTKLQKWGMKLLLSKGHRNIAVGAIARKLVHYIWHALNGRKPSEEEKKIVTVAKIRYAITNISKEELNQTPFKNKRSYQLHLCEQLKTLSLHDDIPLTPCPSIKSSL